MSYTGKEYREKNENKDSGMTIHIDLHIHSSISADGEIAPEMLVDMALQAGYQCIAITDHNRVGGVAQAIDAGIKNGVTVIPGIEMDCDYGNTHLHILGYGIDHTRSEFEDLWQTVKKNENNAANELMDKIASLGIAFDKEAVLKLAGDNPVVTEQVGEVALADSRNDGNPLLESFRPGGTRSDNPLVNFYWDICSPGKPAYVHVPYITLEECIAVITGAGGIPVLAHPGQSLKNTSVGLPDLAAKGIRGVEAFSSYHSPEECARWNTEAKQLGLTVTCGSDFHGKIKPAIAIGQHGATGDMEEILNALLRKL